jgi:amidase
MTRERGACFEVNLLPITISPAAAIRASLLTLLCFGTHGANAADSPVDVEERSILELRASLDESRITSRALVDAYLARIATIDDAGPRLNAVLAINPAARPEADARDAERRAGDARGALHGIPVLIKDNIDAQPMATTAGSLALADHRPRRDAFLVQRLRDAGAVILGKTNLSEWANFRSTRSTSGWSSAGGQTRNPYALDRNPCGSSSGTAAAIAASLATVGVGTETDGSIICPAAMNGLVGIKPTVGLVSRHGIVPISTSQDTAGPMARNVADAAALLQAMRGGDPRDAASSPKRDRSIPALTENLRADALRGVRLGVIRRAQGSRPDVDAVFERALSALRGAGAELVDPVEIATQGQWSEPELQLLLHEFKPALETYLRESEAPIRSLAQLIDFNAANAETTMPWFGQELLLRSVPRATRRIARRVRGRADWRATKASTQRWRGTMSPH